LSDWQRYEPKFWKIRPIHIPTVPKAGLVPAISPAVTPASKS
jgi:hypothetical protein